jgi:hypothetical protein
MASARLPARPTRHAAQAYAQADEAVTETRLLTPEEAAEYLQISTRTLRRLDVPRVRLRSVTRYDRKDLDTWLDSQKVGGSSGDAGSRASASATKVDASRSQQGREILDRLERRQRASTRRSLEVGAVVVDLAQRRRSGSRTSSRSG